MKKAYNKSGKLVDIIESNRHDTYNCPVCKEILTRKFGAKKQYFAHPEGKGDSCELKFKLIEKEVEQVYTEESNDILLKQYYNKKFDNVHIDLSDYKSEEGYYLTKEQKDIIFAKEDRVKVSALAGSAKTSTLYYYAKERPFKKILYLVYNKAMKDEAEKTFGKLSHVDIKTTHGLAYSYVGRFYKNKLTFNYGIVDIIKDLNLNWNRDMELAAKIDVMMKEYMLSEKENFEDIEIFTDDKQTRQKVINNCQKLWNLKKNYNNTIKVEHDFYLKLFQLSKTDLSNKYDIIALDECLPSSQYVKTDKGVIKIKKLYDMYMNKIPLPLILSYNEKEDKFEYKPMISASKSENRQLLKITTEGLNILQCTENHKILTQRGYVRADELIIGKDSVIIDNINNQKTKYKLNEDQLQIVLGSFLGDGCLSKQSKYNTYRLDFTQGEKQFEYFKSKISAFNLGFKKIKSGYTDKISIYKSNTTKVFMLDKNIWELLKNISPLGLAIWYQDDGSYNEYGISINSNQLNYQQTKYIRDIIFNKYNIDFKISKIKGKYYYLRAITQESHKFLKLISKYMHPNMQYKTNINIINNNIKYNDKYLNHGGNYIKSIEKIQCEDVYDIGVQDNHNFVTTRSFDDVSSGIVVHNCQDSNFMVFDILLNSKVKGIVMIGDKFQQLYSWRKATNIMPKFEGIEYKLTTSFRVGQNIANVSNLVIKDISDNNIEMKGFNTKQVIVDKIDKNKPYVCLCRTNSYIFAEVFDVISNNKKAKLFFEGGYNSYNFQNIYDAYYFYKGHKVNNPLFNKFKNYDQMIEYAKTTEDLELLALQRMIYKYGDRIPSIVGSIKNNTTTNKNESHVIFSTIHRSKGQTYVLPVYISDDHFDIEDVFKNQYIEGKKDFDIKKYYEEMCILYVAITRAAGQIELSDKLKNYLILRYKTFNNY